MTRRGAGDDPASWPASDIDRWLVFEMGVRSCRWFPDPVAGGPTFDDLPMAQQDRLISRQQTEMAGER